MKRKSGNPRTHAILECRKALNEVLGNIAVIQRRERRLQGTNMTVLVPKEFDASIYKLAAYSIRWLSSVGVQHPQTRQEMDDQITINDLLKDFRRLLAVSSPVFNARLAARRRLLGRSSTPDEIQAMLRDN